MMPGNEIKVNQVWTTDTHGRGGQIFDIWVQEIVPSDMQTVCDIKWAYTHRPWEQYETEYNDFLRAWKLKWEVATGSTTNPRELPNHKPGDAPFSHYEHRNHQELHRLRMQHLSISGMDFSKQPLSELVELVRMELSDTRMRLSDFQSAGMWPDRFDAPEGALTCAIAYLHHVAEEMRKIEATPIGKR